MPSFLTVLVALVLAAGWGYGCGRTSLDDGFGPASDLGGNSGGLGGNGSGGVSGIGGAGTGIGGSSAPSPCGTSQCLAGSQVCCTRVSAGGQTTASCVPAGTICAGVSTACVGTSNCAANQVCCASLTTASTTCQQSTACTANGQFILCDSTRDCPTSLPRCCMQAIGLAVCLATNLPCPSPR